MSASVDIQALQRRYEADQAASRLEPGANVTEERLARAFDAIGWRGAGGASSEEVAAMASIILTAGVREHRDVPAMIRELAELLRNSMAPLDGSLPAVSEFVPAAADILRRYVASE